MGIPFYPYGTTRQQKTLSNQKLLSSHSQEKSLGWEKNF